MEDDQSSPQAQPLETMQLNFVDEPEDVLTVISDVKVAEPSLILATDLIEELFDQWFGDHGGEDHHVDLINEGQLPTAPT